MEWVEDRVGDGVVWISRSSGREMEVKGEGQRV